MPSRARSSADLLGRPAESGPVMVPLLSSMSWLTFSASVMRESSATSRESAPTGTSARLSPGDQAASANTNASASFARIEAAADMEYSGVVPQSMSATARARQRCVRTRCVGVYLQRVHRTSRARCCFSHSPGVVMANRYGRKAESQSETRHARAQGRHFAQRPFRQESHQPQTGDRDRTVGGAARGRQGATAARTPADAREKEVAARGRRNSDHSNPLLPRRSAAVYDLRPR